MDNTLSQDKNEPEESGKISLRKLIGYLLQQLNLALNSNLDAERILIYTDSLDDLSELQIKHTFKRAVKSWMPAFGRQFPSPAELRNYAQELDGNSPHFTGQGPIDPEKIPKGWTAHDIEIARLTIAKARQR